MDTKTKKTKDFDAVTASRKWKTDVGRQTEDMTSEEVLAFFDRAAVNRRFQAALEEAKTNGTA